MEEKIKKVLIRKLSITTARQKTADIRRHLQVSKGMTREEAKEATKHFYKTYRIAFEEGCNAIISTLKDEALL